jgi:hypothetical protein
MLRSSRELKRCRIGATDGTGQEVNTFIGGTRSARTDTVSDSQRGWAAPVPIG